MKKARVDTPLVFLIGVLLIGGTLIFSSAAFGFLARGETHTSSVVFNHLVLGVLLGLVLLLITSRIDYKIWRKFAPHLFILSLLATAAVFIPQIGFEHGGGQRWILIAGMTFQPSEALKVGAIIFAAAYFAMMHKRINDFQWGIGGFIAILSAPVILLLMQPDLGTLGIVVISVGAVFFAAGAAWRDLFALVAIAAIGLVMLATFRPYVMDRITVFLEPSRSPQAEGFQIQQSLIAIGSGGFLGRGFGQGVQKFTYLPEPMGDSIFAVAGEELGFVGTVSIVGLFLTLALRGFWVAARAPDTFGALLAVGIAAYLSAEAFVNIAAMLGMAPLTGVPLTFISQGGSAMLISLAAAGILLNISRSATRKG